MVKFGPSGTSPIFYDAGYKITLDVPNWLNNIGLQAYEYSFGAGYRLSLEKAQNFGIEFEKYKISLSLHAPYYINFANPDNIMIEKSFSYVLRGFEYLKMMKGKKLVVHLATQGKLSRDEALFLTSKNLDDCLRRIYENNFENFYLCPETMGKFSQIGNYKEIIDLCVKDKILIPTFDFGHINCLLGGELKNKDDYKRIFDYSFEKLGEFKTKNCHIHFSKIQFSAKGEIRHLNYDDENFGPSFEPFAEIIYDYELTPTVICESKNFMAEDALTFQSIYNQVKTMKN
ncbi:MAG: TIM barrel protein [Clostridia bacterium]|nr:TIM barrel protein [Clostridia bacterium]MDD3862414.1 TIM barrel protein [Clostridia bacterium]MDD4408320.1 TIM barrel protein [Clostridia bacterium]